MNFFTTARNKIRKTFDKSINNENTINNEEILQIRINPVLFSKKINKINIVTNQQIIFVSSSLDDHTNHQYFLTIENIPEVFVPFVKPRIVFSLGDGFSVDNVNDLEFRERWIQKSDNIYDIQIFVNSLILDVFTSIPSFVDIDLYIFNPGLYSLTEDNRLIV